MRLAFANADLRRVQLAHAGSILGSWAYSVGLAVYAYQASGATGVALVTLVRIVPAAIAAPFLTTLGDRFGKARLMLVSDLVRAGAMVAMAAAAWTDAPAAIVYAGAAVSTLATTAFRPAQQALLPGLARTPEELTASNVASSTIDSVGVFVGPALGGLLLAVSDTGTVFAANGLTFLWSAYLIMRMDVRRAESEAPATKARQPFFRSALGGFGVVLREPGVRIITVLTAAQIVVYGALSVLVPVLAFDLLDIGEAGVGYLNSALGIGGLVGSVLAFGLVANRRLAALFGVGTVLWGLPLVAVGLAPEVALAAVLLGMVGLANTLVDVSGLTLLQRAVPEDVLTRVFGVFEIIWIVGSGIGALSVPILIELVGERGAFVAAGALLPVLALLYWRSLSALDQVEAAPAPELELLRRVPFFTPLLPTTLVAMSRKVEHVTLSPGERVFSAGDPGDRFYVVADGELELSLPDDGGTKDLGPGDYFGEIALLRAVPRTGTVTARTPVELLALARDDFLAAVLGTAEASAAAEDVVGARLGVRPATA